MTDRHQGCFRRIGTGAKADGSDDTGRNVAGDHGTRPFAAPGHQGSPTSTRSFNPETAPAGGLDRCIIRARCLDTRAAPTSDEKAGCVWHIGAGSDGVTGPLHICLLRADENDHTGRLLAGDSGTRALAALDEEAECVWRLGDGCNAMTGRL